MKLITQGRYATVTSTLALLVALGGTTYAAATISGKDIKNNSVSGKDIKDSSLDGKDLKDNSVSSADLATSTKTAFSTEARDVNTESETALTAGNQVILSLSLPAGKYVVQAKVLLERLNVGGVSNGSCYLFRGDTNFDFAGADAPDQLGARLMIVNMGTVSATQPTTVSLRCQGANAKINNKRLIALKVGNVIQTAGPTVP